MNVRRLALWRYLAANRIAAAGMGQPCADHDRRHRTRPRAARSAGSGFLSANQGPSGDYWFGTVAFGRDVFSRVMAGARVSLTIGMPRP